MHRPRQSVPEPCGLGWCWEVLPLFARRASATAVEIPEARDAWNSRTIKRHALAHDTSRKSESDFLFYSTAEARGVKCACVCPCEPRIMRATSGTSRTTQGTRNSIRAGTSGPARRLMLLKMGLGTPHPSVHPYTTGTWHATISACKKCMEVHERTTRKRSQYRVRP